MGQEDRSLTSPGKSDVVVGQNEDLYVHELADPHIIEREDALENDDGRGMHGL